MGKMSTEHMQPPTDRDRGSVASESQRDTIAIRTDTTDLSRSWLRSVPIDSIDTCRL